MFFHPRPIHTPKKLRDKKGRDIIQNKIVGKIPIPISLNVAFKGYIQTLPLGTQGIKPGHLKDNSLCDKT